MPCVALLVATGLLQTIRLTGSPLLLLSAGHGRLILVKVVLIAALLRIAAINRARVSLRFARVETVTPGIVVALRRAMGTEFGIGLAALAVTATLVVSPPLIAQDAIRNADSASTVLSEPGSGS